MVVYLMILFVTDMYISLSIEFVVAFICREACLIFVNCVFVLLTRTLLKYMRHAFSE